MEEYIPKSHPLEEFALPPQSHRLKHFLLFILVAFLLSVGIGLMMYANISKQGTIVREEIKLLTESEVQEYRNHLPTETVSYVLPEIEFDENGIIQAQGQSVAPLYNFETPASEVTETTEIPSPQLEDPTVITPPTPPSTPVSPQRNEGSDPQRTSSISTTPVPLPDALKPKPVQQVQGSIVTASGREVEGFSDDTPVGEKKRYEIQGVAFIVSPEYGYLTLLDRTRNRELTVLVTTNTEITLGGGHITLSAIESGDTLYVKGEGYEDSERIDATSIAVTAQEELVIIRS